MQTMTQTHYKDLAWYLLFSRSFLHGVIIINIYRIVGKFGKLTFFQVFGERKFGELIDQPIVY